MQKDATNQHRHSWFWPVGPRPTATSQSFVIIFFSILGLSFNFSSNKLLNGWESLTNHCFFWPSAPTQPALALEKNLGMYFFAWMEKKIRPKRMKDERDIRVFITDRLTDWQTDRVTPLPHPVQVGANLYDPFDKLPYSLCSQGDHQISAKTDHFIEICDFENISSKNICACWNIWLMKCKVK